MLFFSFFSGTVVTGRVTRGKLKTGTEIEIIGYGKSFKAKVNGNSLIIISSGQENLYFICLYFVFLKDVRVRFGTIISYVNLLSYLGKQTSYWSKTGFFQFASLKVNNNKFSSQNFVISSQNYVPK